jgi:hypothetical protein
VGRGGARARPRCSPTPGDRGFLERSPDANGRAQARTVRRASACAARATMFSIPRLRQTARDLPCPPSGAPGARRGGLP